MFKKILNFLIPILLTSNVVLFAQDDCPDDFEFYPPGENEPGCIDYNDCNENDAYDVGEPCYDGDYGDTSHYEGDYGDTSYYEGGYMDEGPMHPIEVVAMAYGEHTWLNCEASSFGAPSYWIGDEEFAAYPDPLCEEVFNDFFLAFDVDDDGNMSIEEASVVWGEDPEFELGFDENDLDDDGFVDHGEFMAGSAPPEPAYMCSWTWPDGGSCGYTSDDPDDSHEH